MWVWIGEVFSRVHGNKKRSVMYHSIIHRASARAGVEPKLVHFSRTSKWATVRRNAQALSPAVSAATYYPNVVQVLSPRTAAVRTWSFRAETKCRRPGNASLWPLFNWPRAVRLSPVPSLTAGMCQHSFLFKSMRRALLAGNVAVCRSDSNLTDTWAFFLLTDLNSSVWQNFNVSSAAPQPRQLLSVQQENPGCVCGVGTPRGLLWILLHSRSN